MNKHIIVTSFALVLTMTVVLAVGKTEGTVELNLSGSDAIVSPGPDTRNDINEQILIRDISQPVQKVSGAVIQPEVNEGDMILGQELPVGHQAEGGPVSPLMESLARIQGALKTLEQVAASTEQIVVALEKKKAAQ